MMCSIARLTWGLWSGGHNEALPPEARRFVGLAAGRWAHAQAGQRRHQIRGGELTPRGGAIPAVELHSSAAEDK